MPTAPITAQAIVERIQKNVNVPWKEPTVDVFKCGNPQAPVTGVAVTMVPTMGVLEAAVRSGCNFIVAHEPLFFGHLDETEALEADGDAVWAAKSAYLEEHGLVVWRFHDYWHYHRPDGILQGMIAALGWEQHLLPGEADIFSLPAVPLAQFAAQLEARLKIRALRIVGPPDLEVMGVALAPGCATFDSHRKLLSHPQVQVLVMGEAREWETIAYAADAADAGLGKALVILGHTPSEQAGMEYCARWLRDFVPEVPVHYIASEEPFWMLQG